MQKIWQRQPLSSYPDLGQAHSGNSFWDHILLSHLNVSWATIVCTGMDNKIII